MTGPVPLSLCVPGGLGLKDAEWTRGGRMSAIKGSWHVLRHDLELLLIPVIAATGGTIATGGFIGLYTVEPAAALILCLPVIFLLSFGAILCNAAVVGAAVARMAANEDPTLRDALRIAWRARGRIARWTGYAMFVGWLIGMGQSLLESVLGWLGSLFGYAAEVTWSVVTYLVIPVLLFEDVSTASEAVTWSKEIAKRTWGDQLHGRIRIWLATGGVAIVAGAGGLFILLAEFPWSLPVAILIWLIGIPVPIALGTALAGVFNAAMYLYAARGVLAGPFDPGAISGAVRTRSA